MRYKAIIFDLFGTLIDGYSETSYEQSVADMASIVGAPLGQFSQLWRATYDGRAIGAFSTLGECVEHVCRDMCIKPSQNQLAATEKLRFEATRRAFLPRPDALDTITELKSRGYRVGLITDCAVEVPHLWPSLPFASQIDFPVFSCQVGIKKPHPRIYQLACQGLGVSAQQCLYVGDGGSRELSGAAATGMTAVLIQPPTDQPFSHRVDAESWDGLRISSLTEILAILDRPEHAP